MATYKQSDQRRFDIEPYSDDSNMGKGIGSMSYPMDLMNNPIYGGNYVLIYVNTSAESKLINETKYQTVDPSTQADPGALVGDSRKLQATPASVAGVSALVGSAKGLLGGGLLGGNIAGALKGAASFGGLGAASAAIVGTTAGTVTRPIKQLKQAIALHMPNQLNVRYTANYDAEDTVDFAMASAAMGTASDIIKSISENKSLPMNDVKEVTGAGAVNLALRNGPQAGALSKLTGLAPNPRKEQIFKGVDFRTFTFDYQFFPRSSDEAAQVLQIIETFRLHMHPEFKDANSFLYVYPSEFDIVYITNNKENTNIHKHTSCVLTEMAVNYTPNGQFTAFENGMPTQTNVSLTFKELALLDKGKIANRTVA